MTRSQAFLRHFMISAAVVSAAMLIIFFVWYPAPYFRIAGAWSVVQILIGVDLILGPLLTLMLYRAGKPGLMFDLYCIALMQLAALTYGMSVIYNERPYFTVFVIDRFEVWAKKDIDEERIQADYLKNKPWIGPIYAVATMPESDKGRTKIIEGLFAGEPDLDRLPEYWSPYAEKPEVVAARSINLSELKTRHPDAATRIDKVMDAHADAHELIGLPVMGKEDVFILVLDGTSPQPVDLIQLNPWINAVTDDAGSAEVTNEAAAAPQTAG